MVLVFGYQFNKKSWNSTEDPAGGEPYVLVYGIGVWYWLLVLVINSIYRAGAAPRTLQVENYSIFLVLIFGCKFNNQSMLNNFQVINCYNSTVKGTVSCQ